MILYYSNVIQYIISDSTDRQGEIHLGVKLILPGVKFHRDVELISPGVKLGFF